MAEAAERLMSVEEFLAWDDGTDRRYELVDGVPMAMAPPASEHRTIVANATGELRARLRHRPPCRPENEAGIRISDRTRWQADIAVTCGERTHDVDAPLLIVEVLSPSTRARDLDRKLGSYKTLESVQEIWLVDSERRWTQVWWRQPDGWHGQDLVGAAAIQSGVLEGALPLDELYLNTGL